MPSDAPAAGWLSRARPWAAAASFYLLLAGALLWPLVRGADRMIVWPGADGLLTGWIMWWNLQVVPLTDAWWNAPMFYPARGALAFSELLLGQMPIAAPVLWLTGNPALADNAAVFLSFPLCALAAHALVKELTGRHDAGVLAGLAFGFGAFRANHIGHVQLLSAYWMPVALLCLHRSLGTGRRVAWLTGAGAACLMQVLCNGYMLFQLPLLIGGWALWFPRTMRGRAASLGALVVGLVPMAPLLLEYRAIHAEYGFERSYEAIRDLSADVSTLFQAHPFSLLLGRVMPGPATSWFPGVTAAGLLIAGVIVAARRSVAPAGSPRVRVALLAAAAIAGAAAASFRVFGPWALGPITVSHLHKPLSLAILAAAAYGLTGPRAIAAWRERSAAAFYALAAVLFFALSFGPEPRLWGTRVFYQAPYTLLLRVPGYYAIRAPDRMALLGAFCLAVVIALLYARWAGALRARRRVIWCVLCAGLALDGWFRVAVEPTPSPGPPVDWHQFEAVLELPLLPETDVISMFRALPYGRPSINGGSGYYPQHYYVMRDAFDEADVTVVNALGRRGPLGVVVRASAERDRLVDALSRLDGAAPVYQSTEWTVFRVLIAAPPPAASGPPIEITGITGRGPADALNAVTVALADVSSVGALALRVDRLWPLMGRHLAIDTSLDGADWAPAWQGSIAAPLASALLQDPLKVSFALAFDRRQARYVRVRRLGDARDRTLPVTGISVH